MKSKLKIGLIGFSLITLLSFNNSKDPLEKKVFNYFSQDNPELDPRYHFNETDLKTFNGNIDYLIKKTFDNKKAIIIDKAGYSLYLIENKKPTAKYPVQLGSNPYDNKKTKGDSCTPEGIYKITKKQNTENKKSLLLDYPNYIDKSEAREYEKIEIFAKQTNNKNTNYTNGSIKLSQTDFKKIFPKINTNSSVLIVRYQTNKKLKKIK